MLRDRAYLLDILDAAKRAVRYASAKTREEFLGDVQCQDAVIRRLEIIGEATRRVSDATREAMPELPWSAMVGMRNILIHRYDSVDMTIVWDAVHTDLPPIIAILEKALSPDENP